VVRVHHDHRRTVRLQLVHHFEVVLKGHLLLPTGYPLLQGLDSCLQFSVLVLELGLAGLDGLVLLGVLLLLLGQTLTE
jgi:hypothetical protein